MRLHSSFGFFERLMWAAFWVVGCAAGLAQPPSGEQIAAYGRVSPGDRAVTVAIPYQQGALQIVAALQAREGDRVTKGQKLAETTGRALAEADVAIAKTHLVTAQERLNAMNAAPKDEAIASEEATIKGLEADAQAAKARKRPDTVAGKREATAQEESLDWKVTAAQRRRDALREVRPADVAVARAEIAEAEAALHRSEALLALTEITAPMDGEVLKILTLPGETATQGLLELGETKALVIKAELSVPDAARVKAGAHATVKSTAWAGSLEGTVVRLSPRVERSLFAAPATFANVDRQIVEATIVPTDAAKLTARPGTEVTVLIAADPAAP